RETTRRSLAAAPRTVISADGHAPLCIDCLSIPLGLSRHGLHALDDFRFAKNTLRLEEVQHLRPQFVDRGVCGAKLSQARSKFESLREIVRTLSFCPGVSKIRDGG